MSDPRESYEAWVIAVGGPPHSGKSVLGHELYNQLLKRQPTGIFLERACPDGEGMWFFESDPEVARALRRKGGYTPEFKAHILDHIRPMAQSLRVVLLDLGGKLDDFVTSVVSLSTHLVVVSSSLAEGEPWIELGHQQGCTLLAFFESRIVRLADGRLDTRARSELNLTSLPARGTLFNLDREGSSEPYEDAVDEFAQWLLARRQSNPSGTRSA